MRAEVCAEVRIQELTAPVSGRWTPKDLDGRRRATGQRLLATYAALAARREHLLHGLLGGQPPRQWAHYPEDDAIDHASGYQWFYHSHSPEDRPGAIEHGHFHLFARRRLWSRRLQSKAEKEFAAMTGDPVDRVNNRHLLAIGMNAKGVPTSLFTVNSWVTGDLMLSATLTEELLARMTLDTGYPEVDAVLEGVIALCREEIHQLLAARDDSLSSKPACDVLADQSLEVLSEAAFDLDQKLRYANPFPTAGRPIRNAQRRPPIRTP